MPRHTKLELEINVFFYEIILLCLFNHHRWFSVGICKYKPGYKSHDQLVEITAFRLERKSCKDFFLNKYFTNEST